jgi:hypothetical protein
MELLMLMSLSWGNLLLKRLVLYLLTCWSISNLKFPEFIGHDHMRIYFN